MYSLYDTLDKVQGIGPVSIQILATIDIKTIKDLLWYIPFKYVDRTKISKISDLVFDQESTIIVKVIKIQNIFTNRGFRLTSAIVGDETGTLNIVWFNQHFITKAIKKDTNLILHGKLTTSQNKLSMNSPGWVVIQSPLDVSKNTGIVPIYTGISTISTKWIQNKINHILQNLSIREHISQDKLELYQLCTLYEAFTFIHNPKSFDQIQIGKKRLAFDEFLFLHLKGIKTRNIWEAKSNSHKISLDQDILQQFINTLNFTLTNSQVSCINQILSDLNQKVPMNRLLQGDVGSGKTIVAEVALLATLQSGYNCLLMAPTQILADQHYKKMSNHLNKFGYEIQLVTGNIKSVTETKKPQLIIATHAILYRLEQFKNIGLIVIDEQHKFGVTQRTKVVDHYTKDEIVPNLLTMTATPIPRSVALTIYGDLMLSTIDELPTNRIPTITKVLPATDIPSTYEWILDQIKTKKYQAFMVCPFIDDSESIELKHIMSAQTLFTQIKKVYSNKLKIDLLHGKIKDKDSVIQNFKDKKIDILISTSVIEVGVDIPNANIIVIYNPERFGLASLHQMRGRVGRGGEQGYCIMFTPDDQNESKRLKYMEKINNGNQLAEIDLKMRGPGNIYGDDQHGFLDLKVADISDHQTIITTKEFALQILQNPNRYPIITSILNDEQVVGNQ